ncbi:HNH endonuclease [Amycolatopsis kentuckyensis]|uniref:HNH endonuclease n=1 Tax=Amycolatopsis kentuckyensis TaxID=218823 RepID=UPI0033656990
MLLVNGHRGSKVQRIDVDPLPRCFRISLRDVSVGSDVRYRPTLDLHKHACIVVALDVDRGCELPRRPNTPCDAGCGTLLWPNRQTSRPPTCRACRRQIREVFKDKIREADLERRRARRGVRKCAWCKKTFSPGSDATKACSLSCAQYVRHARDGRGATEGERRAARLASWQRKNRKRRALKAGARHEAYTTAEIAERDKFTCQLCGMPVDMGLKYPDTRSPSIDHIVAIANGGDDTPGNVQLAHFGCNSSKGVRPWLTRTPSALVAPDSTRPATTPCASRDGARRS